MALDVLSQNVAFEIYSVAGFAVADVGVLVGVGDDGDFSDARVVVPARNGEAYAVDGDGTFRNDIAREILRNFDAEPPVVAANSFRFEARYATGAIHVPLNEMAAKLLACG